MLSAKETAIHLENLRQSHEMSRRILAEAHGQVTLICNSYGWHGRFVGLDMPQTWIPLPWTRKALASTVAADIAKRFPGAKITVRL